MRCKYIDKGCNGPRKYCDFEGNEKFLEICQWRRTHKEKETINYLSGNTELFNPLGNKLQEALDRKSLGMLI